MTTDLDEASFDGGLSVILHGLEGNTEQIKLDSSNLVITSTTATTAAPTTATEAPPAGASDTTATAADSTAVAPPALKHSLFARGTSSTFTFKGSDVGAINTVEIAMDWGAGATTQWHLDRIDVTNVSNGASATFNYKSQLSTWCSSTHVYPQATYTWKVGAGRVLGDLCHSWMTIPSITVFIYYTWQNNCTNTVQMFLCMFRAS